MFMGLKGAQPKIKLNYNTQRVLMAYRDTQHRLYCHIKRFKVLIRLWLGLGLFKGPMSDI